MIVWCIKTPRGDIESVPRDLHITEAHAQMRADFLNKFESTNSNHTHAVNHSGLWAPTIVGYVPIRMKLERDNG